MWLAPVALLSAAAGCFTPKGEEQGQVAWLASGLDTEFPERSVRPDLEIAAAQQAHEAAPAPVNVEPSSSGPTPAAAIASGPRPDDPTSSAPRPVIRVVGTATSGKPAPGAGAHDRIEVSLPDEAASGSQNAAKSIPASAADPAPKRDYDHGLALLNAHDYDHALEALGAVLVRWPDDPVAEGALYWSGECYLAKGELVEAADAFERTLARFPQGSRAPDCLFRLGVCADRLGNPEKARGYFDRLAHEFPKSDAARRVPGTRAVVP